MLTPENTFCFFCRIYAISQKMEWYWTTVHSTSSRKLSSYLQRSWMASRMSRTTNVSNSSCPAARILQVSSSCKNSNKNLVCFREDVSELFVVGRGGGGMFSPEGASQSLRRVSSIRRTCSAAVKRKSLGLQVKHTTVSSVAPKN